jgi:hypothetical protein
MPQSRSKPERIRLIAVLAVLAALAVVAVRSFAPPANGSVDDSVVDATQARADAARQPASSPRLAGVLATKSTTRRSAASPQLPAADAPLADIYNDLKARADAGEAAATTRLYREVQACWASQQAQRAIAGVLPTLPQNVGDVAVVHQGGQGMEVHLLDDLQALVARNATRCAGATKAQLDSLVPVMIRAAQLGDVGAINCYAGSGFAQMPGLIDHPEWLADMRNGVAQMLDYAIGQGDWVAAELLHHAYAGMLRENPAGQAIQPDPAMDYRYLRLERLGATGAFVPKLDRLLADAANGLTPQQIADGDAWAGDTYARYFSGSTSNEVANGANICANPED